ncbi:LptF/LptG family permease [Hansschlegelia zhihuaiae]|uniref:LptF/LptG family permease n=1 Tax=Hansschlegelia zhihuaiae TaxID=405005 RepID=A0A4Q0MPC3_9HYPH|nr:LptF/LptG family permease [Hansschlegelia zhihuaiae]RXF75513.1 LptF/LptG family permease [Hansschlegelia zhihuaiae]
MRFSRYLSVMLFKLALTATFILAFIAEILDLVENAGDILGAGEGVLGILRYVALRFPTLLVHALPLGALVGALITLALLARNSEITAMRAAGRGALGMFLSMLPGALALVIVHSTLIDVIAPRTEAKLAIQATKRLEKAEEEGKNAKTTWLRVGDAVISFDRVSDRGRRLRDLRIYDRDSSKIVIARTTVAEARYRDGKWTLSGAERVSWARQTLNEKSSADGVWNTTMTPDDVLAALSPESRISLTAARKVVAGEQTPNAPLPFYETLIERVYAAPLGLIVMVLLAMPASLLNWRDARSTWHGFTALAAGLLFLLGDGVMTTLGLTGVVAPAVGAWTGLILFALIGAWRLWRIDGGWPEPRAPRPPAGRLAEATG